MSEIFGSLDPRYPEISNAPPDSASSNVQAGSNGIQFLNGANMNLIIGFQFDDSTQQFVPCGGFHNVVLGTFPSATKHFTLSVYASSTKRFLHSTTFNAGYLSVVIFYGQKDQYFLKAWPKSEAFGSELIVCNLNHFADSDAGRYKVLSISNFPLLSNGESSVMLDGINFVQGVAVSPNAHPNVTDAFTRGSFKLCATDPNTTCLTFTPSSIGPLDHFQDAWVVLLPAVDAPLVFIAQTLPNTVDPAFINNYYGISNNIGYQGASQLVFGTSGQYLSLADLAQFQSLNDIPVHTSIIDINGQISDSVCIANPSNCGEANLDTQYMTAISQYPTETFYYYGDFFVLGHSHGGCSASPFGAVSKLHLR